MEDHKHLAHFLIHQGVTQENFGGFFEGSGVIPEAEIEQSDSSKASDRPVQSEEMKKHWLRFSLKMKDRVTGLEYFGFRKVTGVKYLQMQIL